MLEGYAKWTYRFRWAIIVLWLAATVAGALWLPQLGTVVAQKNTNFLPHSSSVIKAQKLMNQINPDNKSETSAVIAIHHAGGLSQKQLDFFKSKLSQVEKDGSRYSVISVQDAFNTNAQAASSFESSDKTTMIALAGFSHGITSDATKHGMDKLKTVMKSPPGGAQIYFTGDAPIQLDDMRISSQGVDKTAKVTIVLLLIILLIVFRSVVAPIVTLFTIGMCFEFSSSLVALFAQHGLPVSNFTQMFLIAVLFGAGTDYCLILLMRFREEMTKDHPDKIHALTATLRAISKTVIFSGSTVFVSFAVLYFANFGLYRSAVGVAVGVLVTLIACLTFVPAVLSVFGGALYWPRRPVQGAGHAPSRFWSFTGRLSTSRPWWTLLALLILLLPIALSFTNQRTFDPMDDIPNAKSVKGFRVVSDAFDAGHVMPMNIVVHTNQNLRTPEGLATIENISKSMNSMQEVSEVDSATRPTGKVITDFQIASQNEQAASGLKQVDQGLGQLADQLNQSAQKSAGIPQGMQKLSDGSQQVTRGAASLNQGLQQFDSSTKKLANGASGVANGADQMDRSLSKLSGSMAQTKQGLDQLSQGLDQAVSGSKQLSSGSQQLSASEQKLSQLSTQLANAIAAWAKQHPDADSNPNWQHIEAMVQQLNGGQSKAADAASQLSQGAAKLHGTLPQLAQGAQQADSAAVQLQSGTKQLAGASQSLSQGASQLQNGLSALHGGVGPLSQGAAKLQSGSTQVTSGLQQLQTSLAPMANGLKQASQGAAKLKSGTDQVQSYLAGSQQAGDSGSPGFYIPQSELNSSKELQQALDAYISPDGHIAKFSVILSHNPYSNTSLNAVPDIEQVAKLALMRSPIHTGTILGGGTTPTQHEMSRISNADFVRTIAIILSAIFILLVLMLRSFIAPIYIIMSLAGTYFVTMGIVQFIVLHILHKTGISWSAPFFVFLLLVALGVDYCIFLMSRFEEEYMKGVTARQAVYDAMRHMGNVIFSAALIMGGTFGSMMVSGVGSLIQIGIAVIVGLIVYTVIFLGFFVPSCTTVIGRAHGWPFDRSLTEQSTLSDSETDSLI